MNRKIVASWVVLSMVLSVVVIIDVTTDFTPTVRGTTLYVNTTGDGGAYTKIQDAINTAQPGDTVYVYNGAYYENVVVNRTINLTGENRDATIIDGGGNSEVVRVVANYVNMSGFKVINGNTGIKVTSSYCNISGNSAFSHFHFGIQLDHASHNIVSNNNCSYSGGITIKGVGIAIETSRNITVYNNTMISDGINLDGTTANYWYCHSISPSNTVNGKPVYYLKNQTGGGVPMGAGQVILANCRNITVENQDVSDGSMGILLGFSDGNIISNNTVNQNYRGIYLFRSHENMVLNNTAVDCDMIGIYLYYSDANYFIENKVLSSQFWGFKLDLSANRNKIIDNHIESNGWGIELGSLCGGNLIYHNKFINNGNQAVDNTNNQWDNSYPSGGNFWSNYGGTDNFKGPNQNIPGKDGIGDTAYIIDADSQDKYPLMTPYKPLENYTILKQGWNLISIPLIQEEQNLTRVLGSIDSWYDTVEFYNISDQNDHWNINNIGKPFGNGLTEITEKMGFWINITKAGDTIFLYNGTQPTENQTIQLYEGWNMVGYPSLTNYNRTTGLNNLTFDVHVDSIWTYNAATQKWKELGPSDYFELGRGYWIHAKTKCEWEVPL